MVSLLQNWRNSTNGRREGCWASRPQMFITTSQGNLPGKCKLRNWEVLVFYTCHLLATIRLLEIAEVLKTLRIQVCHDLPSTLGDPIPTLPCFESGITPLLSGKMRVDTEAQAARGTCVLASGRGGQEGSMSKWGSGQTSVSSGGTASCWGARRLSAGHSQGRAALHTCSSWAIIY